MSERTLFLDACPGERRGVVLLDGRPERLLIEREGDARPRLGEVWRGRITRRAEALNGAFVDLGGELAAWLRLGPEARALPEGAVVDVRIEAEARADKGPVAAYVAPSQGRPGRLASAPDLETRLRAFAADAPIRTGDAAREAADAAEAAALAPTLRQGGATLTVEPTRALVAVDIDVGEAAHGRALLAANLAALSTAARLLRLKALGGLVVIDFAGRPRNGAALLTTAQAAFAPDAPGVVFGALSRFGALELARPHREQPIAEQLLEPGGRPTARTAAQRLVRALEREGRADPGALLLAVCDPETAAVAAPLVARLGPRFQVRADLGRGRDAPDIVRR